MIRDDETLVLAMPRRELFRQQGFTRHIDMAVLQSLAEDAWFAAPSHLAQHLDAKEVRIGVVITRDDPAGETWLVDGNGVAFHTTPVPPEVGQLGPGLVALRQLALVAGRALLTTEHGTIELVGSLHDDSFSEIRPFFFLVYRLRAAADSHTPAGMNWISRRHLASIPLDPISAVVVAGW